MIVYALRRVAQAIPLFLGVLFLMFVLLQLTPGNPLQAIVGSNPVPPAYKHAIISEYHLNQSLPERFVYWLWNLLHGNLGYAFGVHTPVTTLIFTAFPNSLLLVVCGAIVSMFVGIALGFLPILLPGRFTDGSVSFGVIAAFAIPTFWMGQILIVLFALKLGWFPVSGMSPTRGSAAGIAGILQHAHFLILPVVALSLPTLATITRVQQQSALDTLGNDYIVTAELKGLSGGQIMRRHVLRNSLLPVITVVGYGFGTSMGGTILIEKVFGWPGMGNLLVLSIGRRTNQTIIGIVMVAAAFIIIVNLVTDLIYGALDPRIRVT